MPYLISSSRQRNNSSVTEKSTDSDLEIGSLISGSDDCTVATKQKNDHHMVNGFDGCIKFKQSPDPDAPMASKRRELVMVPPVEECLYPDLPWRCIKCNTLIRYMDGTNDIFYHCICGESTSGPLCQCDAHKIAHSSTLKDSLEMFQPPPDLNLLIIGEAGVDKSSFINAFTNYLFYGTLDDAIDGELITLINNDFTTTDEEMNIVNVQNGMKIEDRNLTAKQSKTQLTKEHRFSHNGAILRIIDTPGIDDVSGTRQDGKNFIDILKAIAPLEELHGIIVLLESNSIRSSVTLKNCIEELLSHLHKSARDNIIFAFTNTRSTNFRPGDAMPVLQEHLKKTKAGIKCCKQNVYCFDSEGYRFLAAHSSGIEFDDRLVDSYRKSWEYYVNETNRMLSHIAQLQPNIIKMTLLLDVARLRIHQQTKPMVELSKHIILNINNLRREGSRTQGLKVRSKNASIEEAIDENVSLKASYKRKLKAAAMIGLRRMMQELKEEHIIVQKTAAKLGGFLEYQTIITSSDTQLDYLQLLIDEETKKKAGQRNEELLSALYDSRRIYIKEVALIKKAVKEGQGAELFESLPILRSIANLNNLKHSGQMMRQIQKLALETSDKCFREENYKLNDLSVDTSGILKLVQSLHRKTIRALLKTSSQGISQKQQPQQSSEITTKTPRRRPPKVMGNHQTVNLKQGEVEKVVNYISRCLKSLPHGLSEEDRIQIIIDGLRGEYLPAVTDREFTEVCHLKECLMQSEFKKYKA